MDTLERIFAAEELEIEYSVLSRLFRIESFFYSFLSTGLSLQKQQGAHHCGYIKAIDSVVDTSKRLSIELGTFNRNLQEGLRLVFKTGLPRIDKDLKTLKQMDLVDVASYYTSDNSFLRVFGGFIYHIHGEASERQSMKDAYLMNGYLRNEIWYSMPTTIHAVLSVRHEEGHFCDRRDYFDSTAEKVKQRANDLVTYRNRLRQDIPSFIIKYTEGLSVEEYLTDSCELVRLYGAFLRKGIARNATQRDTLGGF